MTNIEYIEEINAKLESLKAVDKLTSVEALSRANEIVKMINTVIENSGANSAELYEKAEDAYLIASEKAPKDERDMVAFPSNFWSMRAKQERVRLPLRPKRVTD